MKNSKIRNITIFNYNNQPQKLLWRYPNLYKVKRKSILYDESIDGKLSDSFEENKIGGYKLINNELVFDQAQFEANQLLIQELNQKKINEKNENTQRKDLIKNKTANVNDRLNALIEHLGLDV